MFSFVHVFVLILSNSQRMRLKLKKGERMNNENMPKKLSMKPAIDKRRKQIFFPSFFGCCLSIRVFECDKTSMTLVETLSDKFESVNRRCLLQIVSHKTNLLGSSHGLHSG